MTPFTPGENLDVLTDEQVELWAPRTRSDRMKRWRDARFGLFVTE